jgi:glucose-1-phosphate adenylyltransferase
MLPPAKVSGTRLDRTILADGCIVNAAHIEDSIIGIRARVGHDTTVMCAYIMGSDYYETIEDIAHAQEHGVPQLGIGNRCFIQNVIIDKNCRIGDDVRIIGGPHLADDDSTLFTIKEGIVVIKKGAVLPNGFTLGA